MRTKAIMKACKYNDSNKMKQKSYYYFFFSFTVQDFPFNLITDNRCLKMGAENSFPLEFSNNNLRLRRFSS